MSSSVVVALVKFCETLADKSVDVTSKLRVLSTLNEVTLTLSELSESGVGRAVRKLKNEPGELGQTACTLISKWKNLLSEHIKQESVNLCIPGNSKATVVNGEPKSCGKTCSPNNLLPTINEKKTKVISSPRNSSKESGKNVTPTAAQLAIHSCNNSPLHNRNSTSRCIPNGSSPHDSYTPPKVHHESPSSKCKLVSNKKRKSVEVVDSIDSSSGISFMDSLNVGTSIRSHRKKKCSQTTASNSDTQYGGSQKPEISAPKVPLRPSEEFCAEIISSLFEPVNRPDVVHHPRTPQLDETVDEDGFESGDLKFKSKKVLWVPKPNRSAAVLPSYSNLSNDFPCFFDPPSLIDLCVDVLARNISRLDHVGQVPYELLAKALRGASVEDLTRIERYNPQFVGLSDDLWQKYVNRDFQHLSSVRRRPDETWCEFYNRLSKEEAKRLDRIISQSARKVKEEQENFLLLVRRTTLTTEVITPRQMQRRGSRQTNNGPNNKALPYFKPRNMSHPSPNATDKRNKVNHPIASTSSTTTAGSSGVYGGGSGGLLSKLRKQFHSGHLR
ncbi:unnamed protein product [Heterobilharzia americana]|nr:unnamed protein product [Heterobilharzia americana]